VRGGNSSRYIKRLWPSRYPLGRLFRSVQHALWHFSAIPTPGLTNCFFRLLKEDSFPDLVLLQYGSKSCLRLVPRALVSDPGLENTT
jgi:hypothetical protein